MHTSTSLRGRPLKYPLPPKPTHSRITQLLTTAPVRLHAVATTRELLLFSNSQTIRVGTSKSTFFLPTCHIECLYAYEPVLCRGVLIQKIRLK